MYGISYILMMYSDAYETVTNLRNPPGEIFNIGSGQQHSVGEVVDIIIRRLGDEVTYVTGCPSGMEERTSILAGRYTKSKVRIILGT